jgi:hypothetical protein
VLLRHSNHCQPVRLAYQPPASSTFLSEQTSHQQPANSTFLSEQISTGHQPPAKRTGCRLFHLKGFDLLKLICFLQVGVNFYKYIHYGKIRVWHASKSFSCILYWAHGKEVICRAPKENARQRSCLMCVFSTTHGKFFFLSHTPTK